MGRDRFVMIACTSFATRAMIPQCVLRWLRTQRGRHQAPVQQVGPRPQADGQSSVPGYRDNLRAVRGCMERSVASVSTSTTMVASSRSLALTMQWKKSQHGEIGLAMIRTGR